MHNETKIMAVKMFPDNVPAWFKLRKENEHLKSEIARLNSELKQKNSRIRQLEQKKRGAELVDASTCTMDDPACPGPLNQPTPTTTQEQEDFEKRTRDLEVQLNNQLKHFAMMSHEIRTPLNCIIGLSSLLVETELDESQEESLRMIVKSGDLLLSVVNDVLDYSRLESGNLDIHLEPTDLEGTINVVLHAMAAKANERKITISKDIDSSLPPLVRTDGSRVQQVLYNLLGNAVKFSDEGSHVQFSAHVIRGIPKEWGEPETNTIRFVVKDYGKGIPSDQLDNVFLPFNQGTDGSARAYGGTGLGLAITSKLVKGLQGSISASSKLGEWSEFVVDLPCIREAPTSPRRSGSFGREQGSDRLFIKIQDSLHASQQRGSSMTGALSASILHSTPESPTEPSKPKKAKVKSTPKVIGDDVKILVADDNLVNRKILVQMLRKIGAKSVDMAENGLEAAELEERNKYDLVLMDIEMPVLDGLEATKRIMTRARPDREKPPKIVFVTAHALGAFHAKAVAAGGCGFLTKPFNLKKLTTLIDSVDMHRGCRSLMRHSSSRF